MKPNYALLVLFALLLSARANAQLLGYGTGNDGPLTHNSSTPLYMDDIRAKVGSYTAVGSNRAAVQFVNIHGSFSVYDRLLIIQMTGTNIGNHQEVEITNSFGGGVYSIQSMSPQNMNSYAVSGSDALQVIRINQYTTFDLTEGLVTCSPWDASDGSGGVLCFMVNNDLTIDHGLISARGKGYTPDEAGITWGMGSLGGNPPAVNYHTQDAMLAPVTDACLAGHGTVSIVAGETGGQAGGTASAGGANSGTPVYYGGSYLNYQLIMGDPGYFQSGTGAAQGGQGGGWGGDGAASVAPCSNSGASGLQGDAGFQGGDAGKGGRGGGIILIKAYQVDLNTSTVVFDVSGQEGKPGGNGGFGGLGGIGGDGGVGCCSNVPIPQGGNGGWGDIGAGGTGGDGGDGGKSGYAWIATFPGKYYKNFTGVKGKSFAVKGGKGGAAGKGGWGTFNVTPTAIRIKNECTDAYCSGAPTSCPEIYCDADKAMCVLSSSTALGYPILSDIDFIDGTPTLIAQYISKNNGGDGTLYSYEANACSGITTYIAECEGDCDILFQQLGQNVNVNGDYNLDLGQTLVNCTFPTVFTYRSEVGTKNLPLLYYYHEDVNSQATLTDISGGSDHIGFFSTCLSGSGPTGPKADLAFEVTPVQASPGDAGDTPPPGNGPPNTGSGNADDNGIIDDAGGWFMGIASNTTANSMKANVYPNPASREIGLTFVSDIDGKGNIDIKDLTGKVLVSFNEKLQKGSNEFKYDVSKLAPGVYFIGINTDNHQSVLKLVIK